jgi:Tfp pilus assembly PilM family ATPase
MKIHRRAGPGRSSIGLDIGASEVRAVQFFRAGGAADAGARPPVVRDAVFPRRGDPGPYAAPDAEEMAWIAGVLARRGFQGVRVTLLAPDGACSTHVVDLPDRDSGAPAEAIARAEVARARRCAPDRFELASWYLPKRGRTERGMAVACDSARLAALLDAAEAGGLSPAAVDLEEAALARACHPELAAEPDAVHAVLRVGWNSTLGVLTLGELVLYTRRFEVGVGHLLGRFRDRCGLSWHDARRVLDAHDPVGERPDAFEQGARTVWSALAERLGSELDTAITYVSHAHRSASVGRVWLAGYGAGRPELLGGLDEILGMPVAPADGWNRTSADGPRNARLAVAAGLAGRFDA